MHPASNRRKLTYDDLLALPDDGLRHELIDGEHFVAPSPRAVHQLILGNLYLMISAHAREHAVGVVMLAPFDVIFSPHDVVVPDLVYFSAQRFKRIVREMNAQGAPDLAVEILSPSTRRRDEVLKRRLYERVGVREYWIVDPKLQTIRVHTLVDSRYQKPTEFSLAENAAVTTPLLPDLVLPLKRIFELP